MFYSVASTRAALIVLFAAEVCGCGLNTEGTGLVAPQTDASTEASPGSGGNLVGGGGSSSGGNEGLGGNGGASGGTGGWATGGTSAGGNSGTGGNEGGSGGISSGGHPPTGGSGGVAEGGSGGVSEGGSGGVSEGGSGGVSEGGSGGVSEGGSGGVSEGGSAGVSEGGSAGVSEGGSAGVSEGGSAGVGGALPPEDCFNGLDDDEDGLLDCLDPDCAYVGCVEVPPTSWQGYYRVREQPFSATMPDPSPCPDGSSATRYHMGPAGPAQCETCACSALSDVLCGVPHLYAAQNTDCSGAERWTPGEEASNCASFNPSGILEYSAYVDGADAVGGTCVEPPPPDFPNKVSWTSVLDVCAYSPEQQGFCGDGFTCLPAGEGDYQSSLCIMLSGDSGAACPPEWPVWHEVYDTGADDRGCSPCECTPSDVNCIGGAYGFWDLGECLDCDPGDPECVPEIIVDSLVCQNLTPLVLDTDLSVWMIEGASPTGECSPQGGLPTGSMLPQGPATICCK